MSLKSRTGLATVAALAALSVPAVAAQAPTVSKQQTYSGVTAPLTIPGTGVKKGDKLPAGSKLVLRKVTLSKGQTVTLTIKAPAGKRLRGLVPTDGDVGFVVASKGSYVGKKSVAVRASTSPKASGRVSGTIYALAR